MIRSIRADLFFGAVYGLALSAGLWTLSYAALPLDADALVFLALAASAGAVRARIRGLATYDATYPMVLAGLLLFGSSAALLAGVACQWVHSLAHPAGNRRKRVRHLTFDLARLAIAASVASVAFLLLRGDPAVAGIGPGWALALTGHALSFAAMQVGLSRIAVGWCLGHVLARWRRRRIVRLVPGYVAGLLFGATLAAAYAQPALRPWVFAASSLGMAVTIWNTRRERSRSRRRFGHKEQEIYRSVAQALARAMEAKDEATRSHLKRVQALCIDVGRELKLPPNEMEALASAALLHDIGKIAVPEGILTKPGRLTPREEEKIRRHPRIGAEILQAIPFPFPLAPIVRHHHERWDGTGYPSGLAGEAIPLGARILTAVDTFDALTTDRPYRRAVTREQAIEFLRAESGHIFDPEIVECLIERLDRIEDLTAPYPIPLACEAESLDDAVPRDIKLELAQRELQTLYEISRLPGHGLRCDEQLTIVACKLESLIPYRSMVVYALDENDKLLRAVFAHGLAAERLKLMTIPVGQRLSGWAAHQQRAVIGENHEIPLERDGSRSDLEEWRDDAEIGTLEATLVAPMVVEQSLVGVVTLYDRKGRQYSANDRRILVRVGGLIADAVARSLGSSDPEDTSLTDPLTGVPNARFLLLETAHRIAQAAGSPGGFGLLAFRVSGMEQVTERLGHEAADRFLCQVARRFAAGCGERETLVRYGEDLFLVLTPASRSGELVERWHELAQEVESSSLETQSGLMHPVQLVAGHAAYPEDGTHLGELIEVLDERLGHAAREGRAVLPFRARRIAVEAGSAK